jgi:two-component system, OmpR family, phosphate regulon sensor histidine kinase PhoR
MRIGLRAKILLVACGPAAAVLIMALWFQSTVLALLAAAIAAVAGSVLLSEAVDRHVADIETAAGQSVQRLEQRVSELNTDRARSDAILAGMVEGVLVADAGGRLRLINDAARRMLNLEDTALSRPYVEAVRHPGIVRQLSAAIEGERPDPIEVPVAGRIFSAQATPSSATGGAGAVLVLHDISELRRADRVRRDFVANVSHELRTPLTAVRGYVEALMEEPASAEQRLKFLAVIERHTGRMERLVRDLLRLARLDAQQETADLHPCDMESMFRAVIADLSGPIERQQVRLEIAVDPEARVLQADPTKLHDALRNLVENAVNYSPEGGRVALAARAHDRQVVLSVGDEGPGLPESDVGRVFERFYRVDKSRTRDPGGTGLGLSIVRHLVELHGGQVQAQNKPDGGALFTIVLPTGN